MHNEGNYVIFFLQNMKTERTSNRFNFGWKMRHIMVLLFASIGTYVFIESRPDWSEMHRWNRAVGDMSFILIALSMMIGPLSRLSKMVRTAIPWRRELGIHGVLLALAHAVIILVAWVDWDFLRLFGYVIHPQTQGYVMLLHGFGLANIIGIIALVYGAVLALSSSDLVQRVLGGSVWKFLQQSSYVLWMLIIVHTAYFLYLNFQDFHKPVPALNWAQIPFAVTIAAVTLLQLVAFIKTWKIKQNTRIKR